MSSDFSDYLPNTDSSDGEEEEESDLSHQGEAQTTIKSFTVEKQSYLQGHKALVDTVLGSSQNEPSSRDVKGTAQLLALGQCESDVGSSPNGHKERVNTVLGSSQNQSGSQGDGGTAQLLALGSGEPVTGSSHNVIQQNFIQVRQEFGDVTVKGTRNLTIGGTQNIGHPGSAQEEKKTPTWIEKMQKRTASRIERWTKGMVRTAGFQKVMEKLNKGVLWVTIKGSPGEGKTTSAYMALQELEQSGREVFQALNPEEFSEIKMTITKPVIMLDDIFGDLEFDQAQWTRWKPVLSTVLGDREHRSHEEETVSSKDNEEEVTVVLTGRDYVLNSAFSGMGRISDYFTQDAYVVKMSNTSKRKLEEKHAIWNTISNSSKIKLDEETIDTICGITGPHGFPHVCRLFVTLRTSNHRLDAKQFFTAPLEFLNQTILQFMQDKEKLLLFKEMIKRGGKVSARELGNIDTNADIVEVTDCLVGTYMRREDGFYTFDHPSIYDSVAFNICKRQPLFVIKNCNLSFIHERLRLEQNCNTRHTNDNESGLVVYIPRCFIVDLAERFASEISNKNFLQVLSHRSFADEEFTREVMSRITIPLYQLLKLTDIQTDNSFLTLTTGSRSPQLLMYIQNHIQLTAEDMNDVLYGVCWDVASDILTYIAQTSDKLDINVRYGYMEKTPLMIAAETRNTEFVQQIISLKPDLNASDSWGKSVLSYLCHYGLLSAAERVIKIGVVINTYDINYHSPLFYACEGNHVETVRLLLDHGATTDNQVVKITCERGYMDAVKLLFHHGATVNMSLTDTPLTAACYAGKVELIKFLIDKGASVNKANRFGCLPLHRAPGLNKPEVIKCLLENGADVDSTDRKGNTLLHLVAEQRSLESADLLIKAGADVNAQNADGDTPLHIATRSQPTDYRALMKVGANTNLQNIHCDTPPHIGELTDTFLNAGANVNIRNAAGETPLYLAAQRPSTVCVVKLLEFGADVNIRKATGDTPLHIATSSGVLKVINLLVQAGADVSVQNADGDTPLHIATSRVILKIVDILVQAGADVNIQNADGETPLHNAIDREFRDRARTDEAFVEITDMDGQISLLENPHYGKYISHRPPHVTICEKLINHGACVNKQDIEGNTPLHLLCQVDKETELYSDRSYHPASFFEEMYTALVTSLIDHGAEVNIQNDIGEPALHGWCKTLVSVKYEKETGTQYKTNL